MKIILFSRAGAVSRREEIDEIFAAICRHGFDYMLNSEFAEALRAETGRDILPEREYGASIGEQSGESVMVCYGGDGTLLEGVHRLSGADIPVVGINSGRMGFLALASCNRISEVFEAIASGQICIEPRTMLRVDGLTAEPMYALNEVAVQRLGATMISIDTTIDGEHVSTCNGDGVIISTPTGSTAYSLSAGGPVIAPNCRCMVLTPLSPHNLTMRPVVVADSSRIGLQVHTRGNTASVSVDNRTFEVSDHARVNINLAETRIYLAVPHNISFYDTLRDKMMWGVDAR